MSIPIELLPGVRSAANRDGVVILDIDGGLMYNSNPVGAAVISKIQSHKTLDEISTEIANEFGASLDQVQHDVKVFLAELESNNLIKHREPSEES